jgi:hypothetical protein
MATDDRSKLYARSVAVHGDIQSTSPTTCKGGVQRTAGSDGNRCFVDTCKHVPQANSLRASVDRRTSLHAAGRSRAFQWPPNCFSSARNESPGRPIADTALVGIHDTCIRSMESARDLRFTSPLPRYASAVGTPSNSSAES